MGWTICGKNGKPRKLQKSDRRKLMEISMKISARMEKAEKIRMKKVKEFNRSMRKKHGSRKLKCCDSCNKLFLVKNTKETPEKRESDRRDLYLVRVVTAGCPYCRNEVTLKEEYLHPLPSPMLVYSD